MQSYYFVDWIHLCFLHNFCIYFLIDGDIIFNNFRDGLQESNVVSKQFLVDDVGAPDDNDLEFLESDLDTRRSSTSGSSKQKKVFSVTICTQ